MKPASTSYLDSDIKDPAGGIKFNSRERLQHPLLQQSLFRLARLTPRTAILSTATEAIMSN
jgi:hypothetical protein